EDGFGNDVITDFDQDNAFEFIDLSGVTAITDFTDLVDNHLMQVGMDTVIDDGAGNTITLIGVDIADLDASDFLF
ncbi:MAG: calcium-binding protein, partial [Pseudomonadota bacterium]